MTFGAFVHDILAQHDKTQDWLSEQTGIGKGTISAWMTNPTRQPKPRAVYKVAVVFEQFGIDHARVEAAAGYPLKVSGTATEQAERLAALAMSHPRLASVVERVAKLPATEQDEVLSLLEAYHANRHRRSRRSGSK